MNPLRKPFVSITVCAFDTTCFNKTLFYNTIHPKIMYLICTLLCFGLVSIDFNLSTSLCSDLIYTLVQSNTWLPSASESNPAFSPIHTTWFACTVFTNHVRFTFLETSPHFSLLWEVVVFLCMKFHWPFQYSGSHVCFPAFSSFSSSSSLSSEAVFSILSMMQECSPVSSFWNMIVI